MILPVFSDEHIAVGTPGFALKLDKEQINKNSIVKSDGFKAQFFSEHNSNIFKISYLIKFFDRFLKFKLHLH